MAVFHHLTTETYFKWDNQLYERLDRKVMRSVCREVANDFMRAFEESVLISAPKDPTKWYRSVDDSIAIWPHGNNALCCIFKMFFSTGI